MYHPYQVWSSYGRPEAKALHTWRDAARTRGEARRRVRLALGRAMRREATPLRTLTLALAPALARTRTRVLTITRALTPAPNLTPTLNLAKSNLT